jgi:hypothetical protein
MLLANLTKWMITRFQRLEVSREETVSCDERNITAEQS